MTGIRILYTDYRSQYCSLYITFFKRKICLFHFTVDQTKTSAVTERLGADDHTIFKRNIFTVPCKIFPSDNTIAHWHILCMPEGILGIKTAVFENSVFNILKWMSVERIMKYSLCAMQCSILIPWTDHPNSGEITSGNLNIFHSVQSSLFVKCFVLYYFHFLTSSLLSSVDIQRLDTLQIQKTKRKSASFSAVNLWLFSKSKSLN